MDRVVEVAWRLQADCQAERLGHVDEGGWAPHAEGVGDDEDLHQELHARPDRHVENVWQIED